MVKKSTALQFYYLWTATLEEDLEDTKGVIRIRISNKNRQHNGQKLEDTKGVIRIRISKKNRQHNGQKKKHKKTNNDLQNMHIKLRIA